MEPAIATQGELADHIVTPVLQNEESADTQGEASGK